MATVLRILRLLILAFAVLVPSAAKAQGIFVKPMSIDVAMRAGETRTITVEVRDNQGDQQQRTVDFQLLDLTQNAAGSWELVPPDSDHEADRLASCRDWLELTSQSLELQPLQSSSAKLQIRVPLSARGVYFAAILATPRDDRPREQGQMAIDLSFLIPVIIEIQGRPVRQQIVIEQATLTKVEAQSSRPSTTKTALVIANRGKTFSQISGDVRVLYAHEDDWRAVARINLPKLRMIPGATLAPQLDLGRRLPSGRYKLIGTVHVDGRRLPTHEQEVDFVGHQSADKFLRGSALLLTPEEVSLKGQPGASRSTVVTVENVSSEPVRVQAAPIIPSELRGVAIGNLRGDELSCHGWIRVVPDSFTLAPSGRKNIKVVSRIPRDEELHPHYYSALGFWGSYANGESAGFASSMLHIATTDQETKTRGHVMKMNLASGSESSYFVSAKFANTGLTHFQTSGSIIITDTRGVRVLTKGLSGDSSTMLPMSIRVFGEAIDFSSVREGLYTLNVVLNHGNQDSTESTLPIRVAIEGDEKDNPEAPRRVSVIDVETLQQAQKQQEGKESTDSEDNAPGDDR